MVVIVDRLVQLSTEKEEGTRDIASLGLKTVVGEIKPSSTLAQTVSTRLVPKLIDQLKQARRPFAPRFATQPELTLECPVRSPTRRPPS